MLQWLIDLSASQFETQFWRPPFSHSSCHAMLRGTQASFKSGRPITESLLAWAAIYLPHTWPLSSNVSGQGLAHSQKLLPRAGPKKCACSYTGSPCALRLSFLPHFPSSKKHFWLFFFPSSLMQVLPVGFWCAYNIGFARGDSSPPSHCYSQGKGSRQAAGAASLVPLSFEVADGGNNALEKRSWACWHGGVRHPDFSCHPVSPNTPHGMGMGTLSVQHSRQKESSAFSSERIRRA